MLVINLLSLGINLEDNDQLNILHYTFIVAFLVKEEVPILKLY